MGRVGQKGSSSGASGFMNPGTGQGMQKGWSNFPANPAPMLTGPGNLPPSWTPAPQTVVGQEAPGLSPSSMQRLLQQLAQQQLGRRPGAAPGGAPAVTPSVAPGTMTGVWRGEAPSMPPRVEPSGAPGVVPGGAPSMNPTVAMLYQLAQQQLGNRS